MQQSGSDWARQVEFLTLSVKKFEKCLFVCMCVKTHPRNDKPKKGCIFLPSQLYVCFHGELRGNVWVAVGYFVCTEAHFAAVCMVTVQSGVAGS